jgi:hypothetical protein
MENLKQITGNETKISDIAKSFPKPEDVFIINNNWDTIQIQLKIIFDVNNPNIPVIEYSTEMKDIMDTLLNTPFGTTIVPSVSSSTPVTRTYTSAAPTGTTTPLLKNNGTASDFEFAVEENCLYIQNTKESKGIYIKIVNKNGRKYILFSDSTNEENKFRAFSFANSGIKSLNFVTVMKESKLDTNIDIQVQLFGVNRTIADKFDFLTATYGLTSIIGK